MKNRIHLIPEFVRTIRTNARVVITVEGTMDTWTDGRT